MWLGQAPLLHLSQWLQLKTVRSVLNMSFNMDVHANGEKVLQTLRNTKIPGIFREERKMSEALRALKGSAKWLSMIVERQNEAPNNMRQKEIDYRLQKNAELSESVQSQIKVCSRILTNYDVYLNPIKESTRILEENKLTSFQDAKGKTGELFGKFKTELDELVALRKAVRNCHLKRYDIEVQRRKRLRIHLGDLPEADAKLLNEIAELEKRGLENSERMCKLIGSIVTSIE